MRPNQTYGRMFRRREREKKRAFDEEAAAKTPPTREDDAQPGPSPGSSGTLRRQNSGWKVVLLLLAVGFFLFMALEWREVEVWVEGRWELTPERAAERERQLKKPNQAEQYALIAKKAGYYPCLHNPTKLIFLNIGEVWKYGVTINGEKVRYTTKYLQENNLLYRIEFSGDYAQCLAQEKIKLFNYPLLLENLARADSLRLILPPGNAQLR